ncbi:MAG: AAA family ATPase [Pirellulales bacterium]
MKKRKSNGGDAKPAERKPLSQKKVRFVLATLVRRRDAFDAAINRLTPEHFTAGERALAAVWAATVAFFRENGCLPDHDQLLEGLSGKTEGDEELDDRDRQEINEVLAEAFQRPEDGLMKTVALNYLRQFLEDRLAADLHNALSPYLVPVDIFQMTEDWHRRASDIRTVTAKTVVDSFPDDWELEETYANTRSTGIDFLDEYLGGGHVPGEVCLYLGAYSTGKSTFAMQMGVDASITDYEAWELGGREGPLKVTYLVTYEDGANEIRLRALAHHAEISRETLIRQSRHLVTFSTSDRLNPYELSKYRAQLAAGEVVPGEQERYLAARSTLRRNWRILDLSGKSDNSPGIGSGLQEEIYAAIQRDMADLRSRGRNVECGTVIVDYVGAAVRRHMEVNGINYDNMRHFINEFPDHMKKIVLQPLHACGHLFHQFDTKVQQYKEGKVGSHADSAEGKAIGESCDFCFNFSKPDDQGLMVFSCSKARRSERVANTVIRLDGSFSTLRSTTREYVVDPVTCRIHRVDEIYRIIGPSANALGPADQSSGPD